MKDSKILRYLVAPLALAGIAATPMFACDDVTNAQQTLCCSEFIPGNDLSAVDWGLEAKANVNYGALMQAIGDFSATATSMATDVANACQAIATDLGEDPNAVKETAADAKAAAWCNKALAAINTKLGQNKLVINYQPPSCNVNATVQANCEAKCSANVQCEVTPAQIIARCDPGKLSGKCDAQCTGTCEGAANLSVTCEGVCEGECDGACNGQCSQKDSGGACAGRCDGTCKGQCRGSCKVDANANVKCEGSCTGGCSVEVKAPKCKGELKPPSADCQGDVNCAASCQASASAKVECTEPSLTVDAQAGVEDVIATLKVNLPKLLVVAEGKGQLMVDNAQKIFDVSGSVSFDSTKAVACLVPATSAIATALKNIQASVTASASISAKVTGG
jgi:hypothetical protein